MATKKGVADAVIRQQQGKAERIKAEIESMFQRRAACRYLWRDRWGRDGYEYELLPREAR